MIRPVVSMVVEAPFIVTHLGKQDFIHQNVLRKQINITKRFALEMLLWPA